MTTTAAEDKVFGELKAALEIAGAIEPALGKVDQAQLVTLRAALERVAGVEDDLDHLGDDDREAAERASSALHARAAAVAVAAGDEATAHRWLDEAERLATDDETVEEIAGARRSPERFRQLVHGRDLIAKGKERAARKLWKELVKADPSDAIAKFALVEENAPRPLGGSSPALGQLNGFGTGFYGRRDTWPDGSYATTQCLTALWIPVFPIGAYRVADGDEEGSYFVIARERLSKLAKAARLALAAVVVLAVSGYALHRHFNDPHRLAGQRWDELVELAQSGKDAEASLRSLDAALTGGDLDLVSPPRAQRAGAEVVQLSAKLVATPFTAAQLDPASRVVLRYQAMPEKAKGGVARDAMLAALERWTSELGTKPEAAEARLDLLRHASAVADARRVGPIAKQITETRLAVASSKEATAPLEALAIYVEEPSTEAIARASKVVAALVETPSLLLDAGADLDKWLAATSTNDPVHQAVTSQRTLAEAGRDEAQAEGLTIAQLEAMQQQRPWDQHVALALARLDTDAGKLEAAADRLRKLGPPAMLVRDARVLLGQLASATGKLEEADQLLSGLLGSRLRRFVAASAALEAASKAVQDRLAARLRAGDLPFDLQNKLQTASETEQRDLLTAWFTQEVEADATVLARRETYLALGDVVAISLAAGSVKLRRAQELSGPAQSAMLEAAERTFLAIRLEAEGQPEFRLGLGEIYARLGKTKESEAEFAALLATDDPEMSLRVARVYREIGSVARATEIGTQVFSKASSPTKEHAAVLLALLAQNPDESESWYRKADQTDSFVRTSLLSLEAQRLQRQGKTAECAAKFAAVAKAHLASANAADSSGYNNASGAHQGRFQCSGDLSALKDAEAALEKAFRASPESPIVVGNFARMLETNGHLRVLAKRIDIRALRLHGGEASSLLGVLLESTERDAVLADLIADPGIRRSAELLAQYEVLAPNSTDPYEARFRHAFQRGDEAAAAAVVERVRKAKALDVSDAERARARWLSGADDEIWLEAVLSSVDRLDAVSADPKASAKTRAAASYLTATRLPEVGVLQSDAKLLVRARAKALEAAKLWPALPGTSVAMGSLIDEAAIGLDAAPWSKARRERGAVAVLTKLVAENSELAQKIRASRQWSEVAALARQDTSRPSITDLRLARLLGDATLETRAKAALDDKLRRLSKQLDVLLDPTSKPAAEDLAYFDRR